MSWEFAENKQQTRNPIQMHVQYNELMGNIKRELNNLENQTKSSQNRTNIMRLKLIKKNTEKQWAKFIRESIK